MEPSKGSWVYSFWVPHSVPWQPWAKRLQWSLVTEESLTHALEFLPSPFKQVPRL